MTQQFLCLKRQNRAYFPRNVYNGNNTNLRHVLLLNIFLVPLLRTQTNISRRMLHARSGFANDVHIR